MDTITRSRNKNELKTGIYLRKGMEADGGYERRREQDDSNRNRRCDQGTWIPAYCKNSIVEEKTRVSKIKNIEQEEKRKCSCPLLFKQPTWHQNAKSKLVRRPRPEPTCGLVPTALSFTCGAFRTVGLGIFRDVKDVKYRWFGTSRTRGFPYG
ncbi:hypothetical protein CIPAW_16G045600 [Carya illinoinensis]|uniref:Uncharacterized protein n=1 Tax=Carya illinoinensis TaxID=32201 RepID=A0A8T1N3Y0_CARIL|nr:hypothetical protein CIPAW_16G045600 [Carya illinoinensis]